MTVNQQVNQENKCAGQTQASNNDGNQNDGNDDDDENNNNNGEPSVFTQEKT
jgi:hypothetical protein